MRSRTLFGVFAVALGACSCSSGRAQEKAQGQEAAPASLTLLPSAPKPEAKLRDSFQRCVDEAAGATWPTQDCIDEEFKYQDARLNQAYHAAMRVLSGADKKALRAEQRRWLSSRDASCPADDDTDGQGKRVENNYCAMEHTALRANELEAIFLKNPGSPD